MDIKTIGVLGAGSMGNGIAQVAAQAGYRVVMRDIEDRFVENGLKAIDKFFTKSVEKGKMTEEQKKGNLGRIKGTTRMEDLREEGLGAVHQLLVGVAVAGKRDGLASKGVISRGGKLVPAAGQSNDIIGIVPVQTADRG